MEFTTHLFAIIKICIIANRCVVNSISSHYNKLGFVGTVFVEKLGIFDIF
jgi:hypothetical protein